MPEQQSWSALIRAGDKVTVRTRFNQEESGRAVMRSSAGGWVINAGGRHGRPLLADDANIVKVSTPRRSKNSRPWPNPFR